MKPKLLVLMILISQVASLSLSSQEAKAETVAQVSDQDKMVSAIISSDLKLIASLRKKGVSLDAVSQSDETGLMSLAGDGRLTEIKKLVSLGAKVDAVNESGESALFSALSGGHVDVVLFLISKGAKADRVSKNKDCPIHVAARMEVTDAIEKLKLAAPKCLKQKNSEGKTPADLAREMGNADLSKNLKP